MNTFKKTVAVLLVAMLAMPLFCQVAFAADIVAGETETGETVYEYTLPDGSVVTSDTEFAYSEGTIDSIDELLKLGVATKDIVVDGYTTYKITDVNALLALFGEEIVVAEETEDTMSARDYANEIIRAMVFFDAPIVVENEAVNLGVGKKANTGIYKQYVAELKAAQSVNIQAVCDAVGISADSIIASNVVLTNSVTIEIPRSAMSKIAKLDCVKYVHQETVFEAMGVDDDLENTGAAQVELYGAWANGYTGEGMAVAVIDTGLETNSWGFEIMPNEATMRYDLAEIEALLAEYDFTAEARMSTVTAADVYKNAKVPFAFDYSQNDANVSHQGVNVHGTQVASVVAANMTTDHNNAYYKGYIGTAPDAQIIPMKVFASAGAYMSDIVAAMEDSLLLGVDVVNLSLGHPAGLAYEEGTTEAFDAAVAAGITVVASAGNDSHSGVGNLWENQQAITLTPDNSTLGAPGAYDSVLSVASVGGLEYWWMNEMIWAAFDYEENGKEAELWDPFYDYWAPYEYTLCEVLGGQYVQVAYVENNDFDAVDVAGKAALVFENENGEPTTQELYDECVARGAVACLVVAWNDWGDEPYDMEISEDSWAIPCVGFDWYAWDFTFHPEHGNLVSAGYPINTEGYAIYIPSNYHANPEANQVSSFSSWGPSNDLRIKPEITGVGGWVNMAYGVTGGLSAASGTSFSSPQVAAGAALVRQYVLEMMPGISNEALRAITDNILMSTANPVIYTDTGLPYSPRQQGAGLMNLTKATSTTTYLTVDGNRPKIELGDDPEKNGVYELVFDVVNFGDTARTYAIDTTVMTNDVEGIGYQHGEYIYTMMGFDRELDAIIDGPATVTVPAGETVTVTITVTLSEKDVAFFEKYYPNGGYVEGYVTLTEEGSNYETDLVAPFLAFYGDWTALSVFDLEYYYDNLGDNFGEYISVFEQENYDPDADYSSIAHNGAYFYENGKKVGLGDGIGFNFFQSDDDSDFAYNPIRNYISPDNDGFRDGLELVTFGMLRSANKVTFEIANAETGDVYYYDYGELVPKSLVDPNYGAILPYGPDNNAGFYFIPWYGTDAEGNDLPNGTAVNVTIKAETYYRGELVTDNVNDTWTFPITIDLEVPQLDEFVVATERRMEYAVSDNGVISRWGTRFVFDASINGPWWYSSFDHASASATPGEQLTGWQAIGTLSYPIKYYCIFAIDAAGNSVAYAFSDNTADPGLDPGDGVNLVQLDCDDEIYIAEGEAIDIANTVNVEDYPIESDLGFRWTNSDDSIVQLVEDGSDSATIFGMSLGTAVVSCRMIGFPAYDEVIVHVVPTEYTVTTEVIGEGTIEGNLNPAFGATETYVFTPAEGYHIKNVVIDGQDMGVITEFTFESIRDDHEITVEFEINTYTVTFIDGYTGELLGTDTVEHGSDAELPEAPVHEGVEFTGWAGIYANVCADGYVVATYAQPGAEEQYEVFFVDYDGAVLSYQLVNEGESAVAPEDPTREYYTFTGWSCEFDNITADTIIVAQYELDIVIGDVNFDGSVDVVDALVSLRIAIGVTEAFEEQIAAADVNSDMRVGSDDAVIILRYSLGLIESFA